MNRETVLSPHPSAQPAQPATLAFERGSSPERVVEQLEQLANTLESAAAQGRSPPAAADDEECLESYLQRYMQQLTGKAAEKASEKPAAAGSSPVASAAAAAVAGVEPAAEVGAPQRQPAPAPEDRVTISAMRELANASARRAMAESDQVQLVVKTRTTYLAAKAVSLVSSTLAIAYFPTRSTATLACASVFFGIACLLGVRFFVLCRKLGRPSLAPS